MDQHLGGVARLRPGVRTRSISPENPTGAPGAGGRATEGTGAGPARELGRGWKVSPSIEIPAHTTVDLAAIDGPGRITHIWLTTHPDHWRTLLLRARWDGAEHRRSRCRSGTCSARAGAGSPSCRRRWSR